MSTSSSGGPGGREVAYRLFAAEFEDANVSYSESDEERAPNYVVTPTGARVNRLFVVGVLTETERVGGEQIRGRVVDPTGAFVAYAGQYQPDELAFLDRVDPPAFLAITGKARTFSPEDSDRVYTSVRPESISEVDAATRDRWVVGTASQTLDRVSTMASALRSGLHGEELRARLVDSGVDPGLASGVALAVEHYATSAAYLRALRETALDAVRVVAGEKEEVERLALAPDEGGTDDAVLAGLAGLDLGAAAPGAGTGGPAATTSADVGTAESREASELAEATTTEAVTADAGAGSGTTESTTESELAEPETAEPEPESETAEPEPGAEPEPEPEAESETTDPELEPETTTSVAESSAGAAEAGSGTVGGDAVEPSAADSGTESEPTEPVEDDGVDDTAEAASETDEEFEDFEPGEFDLPEEERERVEAEFGTEFETAGEVGPAGEADIETPEAERVEETAEPEVEPEPEPEPKSEPEPEADVDVDEVTLEVIGELDGGEGADREAVVSTVADRYGIDPEEVSEAIEAAMMSGRAYEPSDDHLKAI